MDSYSFKPGKLKFKGDKKRHKKHRKRTHDSDGDDHVADTSLRDEHDQESDAFKKDKSEHAGWWEVRNIRDVHGNIAIEVEEHTYLNALDDGNLGLGEPHPPQEGPSPSEILVAIRIAGTEQLNFKTGFGKFFTLLPGGKITATSDAVSTREQFDVVFEDNKVAIQGCNNNFITFRCEEGEGIHCRSSVAKQNEVIKIRSNIVKFFDPMADVPVEERGASVKQSEVNYVKKFQSFEDRRVLVSKEDRAELKRAKADGRFYESLLDRREKMKSDKFCK